MNIVIKRRITRLERTWPRRKSLADFERDAINFIRLTGITYEAAFQRLVAGFEPRGFEEPIRRARMGRLWKRHRGRGDRQAQSDGGSWIVSKGANMEAMRLSQAPVIASHSGVRALANVSRNMDDEPLLALKKNGRVIQIVGFASYVKTDSKERIDALAKLHEEFGLASQAGGRGGGGNAGGRGRGAAGDSGDGASSNSARVCPVESASGPAPAGSWGTWRLRPGARKCRSEQLFRRRYDVTNKL